MDHEPGDSYDCEACGGTHEVQRGKDLDVAGSSERLAGSLYVRCPEVGFVSLSDPSAIGGESGGGEDWP